MKPLIVYVSGAPGSGKTTLAKILAEQLSMPRVSNDLIHSSITYSNPEHQDRKQSLDEAFVPTVIDMSRKKISIVVDHVLKKGKSENDIIDKIRPYAQIVIIHLKTSDPIGRYVDRVKNSTIPSVIRRQESLLDAAKSHKTDLENTLEPLDLDLPTLTVNTDNGYSPGLDKIIDFINSSFKK